MKIIAEGRGINYGKVWYTSASGPRRLEKEYIRFMKTYADKGYLVYSATTIELIDLLRKIDAPHEEIERVKLDFRIEPSFDYAREHSSLNL